jgi:uncharacterized membrane protein YkvA (DUF1232 family)
MVNIKPEKEPDPSKRHWLIRFSENGEPYGEICRCQIGRDHLADGTEFFEYDPHKDDAGEYVRKHGAGRQFLDEVFMLGRFAKATVTGEYPVTPKTKAIVLGALGYVISPIDAVPDVLPGIGLADDAGLVAVTLTMLAFEIAGFREWEIEQEGGAA